MPHVDKLSGPLCAFLVQDGILRLLAVVQNPVYLFEHGRYTFSRVLVEFLNTKVKGH